MKVYNSLYAFSKLPVAKQTITATRKIMGIPLALLLRLYLVRITYSKMGLITNKNCDFQKDPQFIKAYKSAMRQQYMPDTDIWRYHVNHWAICQAMKLDGDFVECGVYRGSTAMSNVVYIDFKSIKDRKYYLFDTYNGLDNKVSTDEEYNREKNKYPECYKFVVDSFKDYPNVVIVKGVVPETLSQVNIEKVSYLSIDMNCAYAELEAMKHFWSKLVIGGIIVLDDYG
jgi:hypothetical protein